MKNDFEQKITEVFRRDTALVEHTSHPDAATLLAYIGGDMPPERRARLAAHLATCPSCQERRLELTELVKAEVAQLSSQCQLKPFTELAKNRRGVIATLRKWLPQPRWQLRPLYLALVSTGAAVALALALIFSLSVNKATLQRLESLEEKLTGLENQITLGFGIPSQFGKQPPTAQELQTLLDRTATIEDPWQVALVVGTFLNEHGILLDERIDWTELTAYIVQPGDTWESVAQKVLKDSSLWPLLCVVNAGLKDPTEGLSPGETILVPAR